MLINRFLGATALATSLFVAQAAYAQTTPEQTSPADVGAATGSVDDAADAKTNAAPSENEEILVTGSRIRRPNDTSTIPISSVTAAELSVTGRVSVGDTLNDLPQLQSSFSQSNSTRFLGTAGLNLLDLRGLGTSRTLVLVNGRRHVGADILNNAVSPDINTFPSDLIERVDTVTGGSSAVYGSDAIAGVVNFVLKDKYEGLQFHTQGGISDKGDAGSYYASLLAGKNFADGRGNVVLGLGYSNRSALPVTDRAIGAIPISSANGLFTGSANTTPVLFTAPNSVALGLGQTPGSAGSILDFATGRLRPATSEDLYNTNEGTYFSTPLERYNAYAAASYEITPGIELYSSAMFTRNKATIQLAPSGSFSNTYRLPLSNAFLPGGVREQLCTSAKLNAAQCAAAGTATTPGSSGYLEVPVIAQRRFVEFGSRGSPFESTQFQLQAGLRGDVADSLRYDISTQYGETNQDQARTNYGSFSRLQQALRSY
ncbi:MAG: TonB-dependent receptor, partial [Oxalobacteraceae bacterium]